MKLNMTKYLDNFHFPKNSKIRKQNILDKLQHTPTKETSRKRRIDEESDTDNETNYYDFVFDSHKYDTDDKEQPDTKNKKKYTKSNDDDDPGKKDDSNCPVCYEEIKLPYTTNCNHDFCYSCVNTIISRTKTSEWACPICRKMCKK